EEISSLSGERLPQIGRESAKAFVAIGERSNGNTASSGDGKGSAGRCGERGAAVERVAHHDLLPRLHRRKPAVQTLPDNQRKSPTWELNFTMRCARTRSAISRSLLPGLSTSCGDSSKNADRGFIPS